MRAMLTTDIWHAVAAVAIGPLAAVVPDSEKEWLAGLARTLTTIQTAFAGAAGASVPRLHETRLLAEV
jgi:hypothetical protein